MLSLVLYGLYSVEHQNGPKFAMALVFYFFVGIVWCNYLCIFRL